MYPTWIISALTDFNYLISPMYRQHPYNTFCAKLELRFMDCLEAYGSNRARTKCHELLYDMIECRNSTLQVLRSKAIRQERMRQYREGKLKVPFDEFPPLDSYLYI